LVQSLTQLDGVDRLKRNASCRCASASQQSVRHTHRPSLKDPARLPLVMVSSTVLKQ
jgi:hypothetical protein